MYKETQRSHVRGSLEQGYRDLGVGAASMTLAPS